MKETWHGTTSGYVYHKCRCSACKKSKQVYDKEYRRANHEKLKSYYQFNREKIARRGSEYYKTNRKKRAEYYKSNLEKVRKYKKAYYQSNRERILEYRKAHYQANREKIQAYGVRNSEKIRSRNRLYRDKNKDKRVAQTREWKYSNRERVRTHESNRRAAIRGNGGKHTVEQWLTLLSFYDYKCVKCGSTRRIEKDHVVPLSIGGTNDPINLQPLCHECNARKNATAIDYRKSVPDWVFGTSVVFTP